MVLYRIRKIRPDTGRWDTRGAYPGGWQKNDEEYACMSNDEIIYIKAERNTLTFERRVTLGDVMKMECTNQAMLRQLKQKRLFLFPEKPAQKKTKNQVEVFSILKVIELIHEDYPNAQVESIGEQDFVVEYSACPNRPKWQENCKVILVCIIIFFGAAFTIMAFNNDVSVTEVFEKFYGQVMGREKPEVSELEIFYCLGLAAGILVFFNHFGRKKITSDPTPIQVEMRKYEQDMDTTFIENAGRKGHAEDVD